MDHQIKVALNLGKFLKFCNWVVGDSRFLLSRNGSFEFSLFGKYPEFLRCPKPEDYWVLVVYFHSCKDGRNGTTPPCWGIDRHGLRSSN